MGLRADATAWFLQRSASRSARYGDALRFSGTDLPDPTHLSVPTRRGTVTCWVYRPAGEPVGALVHLHGGAFLMRYPQMDDFFCRHVAADCGLVVVNVDYDVAPQKRYPVAQEQAHDVLAWVAHHPSRVGVPAVDGWATVAVSGFSAGGNLAASACLQARDLGSCAPRLQVLGVPSLDVAEDPAAKTSVLGRPMVGPELLALVRATYFKDAARRAEPYASPLRAPDLSGLPPALVLTAEHDALRAEGDRYAVRLQEAGVPVTHHVVPRRDHYFLDGDRSQARSVLDRVTDALSAATRSSRPPGRGSHDGRG